MSEKSMSASTSNGRVGDITDAKCLHMVANSKAADLIVAGAFVKNMRGSVTMPNELKPCPFCGSKHIETKYLCFRPFIICYKCHAQIPCYNNYKQAKEAWNRRADNA